ncbi:CD99 molecule isoform X1 [Brachyhypopomus gauderio]|uniref:CD99 molecule isoform X1 n=1 Tax=Brachyhypopomus gauderio TaxID=698409 RepID=UPI0040419B7C
MTSYLWIVLLACLAGAKAQGFDLSDALDSTPAAPKPGDKPKQGGDDSFDLNDALGPDPPNDPKQPAPGPPKPAAPNKPPSSGGGGFSDDDLGDVAGGEYNPDPGPGRRPSDNDYDSTGGDSGHTQAGQGGQMAGIISAVGVAILGAASSYFAYQKKKLCFKIQGGADPESGRNQAGVHSEPQVLSNLLKTS